jgi:hypothetical protein
LTPCYLQTLFQKEREDLSKNHPLVSSDDDDNAISHGTSLSERKIHTSSEPSLSSLSVISPFSQNSTIAPNPVAVRMDVSPLSSSSSSSSMEQDPKTDHEFNGDSDQEMDMDCAEDRLKKKYHPVSKNFFYQVLSSQEFCAAKAQNCCCPTCLEAVATFEVHLPLLISNCRDVHRQLESSFNQGEKDADFIEAINSFESRVPKEQEFLLSDGLCFIIQ